jgi:hypothetical protein
MTTALLHFAPIEKIFPSTKKEPHALPRFWVLCFLFGFQFFRAALVGDFRIPKSRNFKGISVARYKREISLSSLKLPGYREVLCSISPLRIALIESM